ncbi:deoxyribose-phosphate aldolase [Oscillospiraceae bacterium WX1]
MDIREILASVDHTKLAVDSTWEDIKALCDDAVSFQTASVCISPAFVAKAKAYVGTRMKVCTVIGFPNGYATTAAKVFETQNAVQNGADEIDMVICIGSVKAGEGDDVQREISAVKEACDGRVLKVIIETCLLTEAEKIAMCRAVTDGGADFIKTSTGFSMGGATFDDIRLLRRYIGPDVKIKASGGIRSLEDAAEFLRLGCARIGTSQIVKLLKETGESAWNTAHY